MILQCICCCQGPKIGPSKSSTGLRVMGGRSVTVDAVVDGGAVVDVEASLQFRMM